jgi:integrase
MTLTDAWLKTVHRKPQERTVERADRDGLGARVTKAGKVVFQLRYRYQGKPARMDLGTYPLMSLRQAREEAAKRRGQLEQGQDPRVQKRLEYAAIATAHTNESLVRLWHEKYSSKNKVDAKDILRSFEIHVFPEVGNLPAAETGLARWMELLENVAGKAPSVAERVLANTKQMHMWAARRELITDQPLAAVSAKRDLQVRRSSRGRALSTEELQLIWKAMARTRMAYRSRLFVKLCLFWGCRPVEIRLARVDEFDMGEKVWRIPPERHKVGWKTGRPLVRPIIDELVPTIKEAAALSHDPTMLFSDERSPELMNDRSVLSFPRNIIKAAKNQLGIEMTPWSMYDLRKTARTHWSSLAEPHVCEMMLGHTLPGVWQVYDHHHYLDEQRAAYQAWWQLLTQQLGDPPMP